MNIFDTVLQHALFEVKAKAISIFTFAFYHDHESETISVCVDTETNSEKTVLSMNSYNMKYFLRAVANEDLDDASLWQANIGRSLSLGNFTLVNVARTDIDNKNVNDHFYVLMLKAMVAIQDQVAALSLNPARLIFTCSGAKDEVAYVWSLPANV